MLIFLLPHLTPVSWIDPLENRDFSFIIKQNPNLNKHHCQTLTLRDAFGGLWLCHSNNTSPGTDARFLFLLGKWSSFFEPIVPSRTTQPSTSNTSKNCLKAKDVLNSNITVVQGFPGGAVVENLPANAGDMGSSPGPGRSHMPRSN